LGFVELTGLEARAQKMQLSPGHSPFQAQQKSVVEIGRIVAAILVDHQSLGEGTQLQQSMPVQVRARKSGGFQGQHGAHLSHRDIGYQRLEILPSRRLRSRLAEVPIEGADRSLAPAQFLRLLAQGILALRTLLMMEHLAGRRLAQVNIGRSVAVMFGDLGVHGQPPRWLLPWIRRRARRRAYWPGVGRLVWDRRKRSARLEHGSWRWLRAPRGGIAVGD